MREHDGCGVRGWERPLEEMDLGARAAFSREGKDKMGMFAGCLLDAEVGGRWKDGAERCCGVGVTESPDVLDFFGWKGHGLGEIEVGGKGFEAGWGGGLG